MSLTGITMEILSNHPVQLLATTVLLVHLARAVFWGPAGGRNSQAHVRGFERRAHRLFTEMSATRLAKEIGR
jgi:hypothetical protein